MNDLPNWVLDLVADLLDEEDAHSKLYIEAWQASSGRHEFVRYDWCPAKPLERVPADVRTAADTVRKYREAPSGTRETTDA